MLQVKKLKPKHISLTEGMQRMSGGTRVVRTWELVTSAVLSEPAFEQDPRLFLSTVKSEKQAL